MSLACPEWRQRWGKINTFIFCYVSGWIVGKQIIFSSLWCSLSHKPFVGHKFGDFALLQRLRPLGINVGSSRNWVKQFPHVNITNGHSSKESYYEKLFNFNFYSKIT